MSKDDMHSQGEESVTVALERLALTLGESGAVPLPELVRALERAAERLRTTAIPDEVPSDLVSQAEASRAVGVSRQAVNQWVRNNVVRSYAGNGSNRHGPQVSLAEVAIAANRRSREVPFSSGRRRELLDFLGVVETFTETTAIAANIRDALAENGDEERSPEHIRVLGEFVRASMGVGDQQREFTADGLQLLSDLRPSIVVDDDTVFGSLAQSLRLLIRSGNGIAGFDSPCTALLGLLGAATVGAQYDGAEAEVATNIAVAAEDVWGDDWVARLYDAVFHVAESRPLPLVRYTASLTYLDYNRFLRKAQASGVSINYSRNPGLIVPERLHGAPVFDDIFNRTRIGPHPWNFSSTAAKVGWPSTLDSGVNPFRVFNYEYGFFDPSIHGIRRYCYSTEDVRAELLKNADALPPERRQAYFDVAGDHLVRTLLQPSTELTVVDVLEDFDWWKDHLIRSSPREVLLGLRDERARSVAHALLVSTDFLPQVVEEWRTDDLLSDRMRIYVKNLEFDVIDARYRDDLKRGRVRLIKAGGQQIDEAEAHDLANQEIQFLRAE
ncbi:hypothetical protein MMAD_55020 (plasmid) [Mycolicibacterium madagascariense]|uniref:Helix-turn-helix domain-containing protein n=2 Tax=Mycolicibacterium madagascariense TaxID=212765 RepID=A0A7I7XPN0_9MYCO|nr:hypothetical protein MMAD_55020 [Mycolicibacterium madagascariense]